MFMDNSTHVKASNPKATCLCFIPKLIFTHHWSPISLPLAGGRVYFWNAHEKARYLHPVSWRRLMEGLRLNVGFKP